MSTPQLTLSRFQDIIVLIRIANDVNSIETNHVITKILKGSKVFGNQLSHIGKVCVAMTKMPMMVITIYSTIFEYFSLLGRHPLYSISSVDFCGIAAERSKARKKRWITSAPSNFAEEPRTLKLKSNQNPLFCEPDATFSIQWLFGFVIQNTAGVSSFLFRIMVTGERMAALRLSSKIFPVSIASSVKEQWPNISNATLSTT
uniref:Uncharacterized protein n=1 Tax=Proboscia inermis TaxID=420281 RepID=A0A7S0C6X1_9STRA|mmetsp:Transcript_28529/g.28872  ORF Transcript_28529/g.28872 Transcript_28529/m.28872 type:complete len:202 (+) Transcript_28529:177-782(+)